MNEMMPVITAIIGLIGVVFGVFFSFIISKYTSYISAVTAERSKWIDKLRDNIAELLGVCASIHLRKISNDNIEISEEKKIGLELRHEADRLIALITLQLNPREESGIDKNILDLIQKLVESSEKNDNSYRKIEKIFVKHSQFLLKEEWEKVKCEAKGAILCLITSTKSKKEKRLKLYREFCNSNK